MQPIEATNVPVPQPEVPPCDVLVALSYTPSIGRWILYGHSSVQNANEMQATGKQIRLFRCTDQPPPPVDQAAVAEAWHEFCGRRYIEGTPVIGEGFKCRDYMRLHRDDVAAFVAELVAKGVPRKEQTDAK